jgi:hypothetical protein
MNECKLRVRWGAGWSWLVLAALVAASWAAAPGRAAVSAPLDTPASTEPRVAVAKCLSEPGLLSSQGAYQAYHRVSKGDTLYSRDVQVAIPGFKVDVEPTAESVKLTLWGNLPGLSDSPVLESAVILHDSKAYDLDFTLVRGRVVLTNTKAKGAAKVWLRAKTGVQLILPEPGDSVVIESYGRWAPGVPFSATRKPGTGPIQLWEVFCTKGKLEIKAAQTEWYMAAPPGPAYFHGNSVSGPAAGGPEKRSELPAWADEKAEQPKLAKLIEKVVATYKSKLAGKEPDEVGAELLAAAEKDSNKDRARVTRYLVVHAMAALDRVAKVAEVLDNSKHDEMRKAAVVALRHWIGVREGRDEKLYDVLHDDLGYSKAEAATVMQLLHSPFDPHQAETYETLIAYLKHRKQAVRELAHWHLVRLAPIGRDIKYDASAGAAVRDKAAETWKERIPSGELPKAPSDETKKKPKE